MAAEHDNKIRFQLRPTVVGEAIMDRLSAQGVDRNAESRRWIELGFAAEQAGFRLDGMELRHADRAWHVQPSLYGTGLSEAKFPAASPSKPPSSAIPAATTSAPASPVAAANTQEPGSANTVAEPIGISSLSGKLRKLSA